MKRWLLILGIGIVVVCTGLLVTRFALRDRASGPNISVVETDNCDNDAEKWNKPMPTLISRRWRGDTLILEVDQVETCGGHGRLSTTSYEAAGNILTVNWCRIWDPSQPVAACKCSSRLRFELLHLDRRDYTIKLSPTTRLKWNGKFYENLNDYLKDASKAK
jgi:hypothetical protein